MTPLPGVVDSVHKLLRAHPGYELVFLAHNVPAQHVMHNTIVPVNKGPEWKGAGAGAYYLTQSGARKLMRLTVDREQGFHDAVDWHMYGQWDQLKIGYVLYPFPFFEPMRRAHSQHSDGTIPHSLSDCSVPHGCFHAPRVAAALSLAP